jgi:putative hydrolase of HD superfamily
MKNLDKLIDFFIEIESFKKTFRYSTCPENVADSSAEHSWKVAFMAMALAKDIKNLDAYRAIQICLVHDLAESITGDVDSYRIVLGEITKEQKHKMEEETMLDFKSRVPSLGSKVYELWQEYEERRTPEARFAKVLDKIEALLHMLSIGYFAKKDGAEAELTAKFADKAVEEFPQLKPLVDEVKARLKKEYEKQGFEWKDYYDLK